MTDFYYPGDSWIHRADPRVKLAFAAASVVGLLLITELPMMLIALLGLAILYSTSNIPVELPTRIVRAVLPVSLIMMLLRAAFYPSGTDLWTLGPLRITTGGLEEGAVLGLRLIVMALAIFLWLFTTESHSIVRSFVAIGMPYPWGLSLALALRFIPSIRDNYLTIEQAQRARGFRPEQLGGIRRARAMLPAFAALMMSSFRDSEHVARALESRAYGVKGVQRTYLVEMRFRMLDAVYLTAIVLGSAFVVAVRIV